MATYKLIGKRFNRKYKGAAIGPAYLARAQADDVVNAFCGVPWTPTDVLDAQLTYHDDKEVTAGVSGYDWNAANQECLDAALFCFDHDKEHAYHRAGASAAVYRYELPDAAVGASLTSLAASLVSDPYNSTGVRIHFFTNSTGEIPMSCRTLRGEGSSGEVIADGTTAAAAAKRVEETINNSVRWFPGFETVTLTPTGGLTLQKYLFILVALEDYSVVRGNYLEGSAYMRNLVTITTSAAVSGWTDGETYDLSYDGSTGEPESFLVTKSGILPAVPAGSLVGTRKIVVRTDAYLVGEKDEKQAVLRDAPAEAAAAALHRLYAEFYAGGGKFGVDDAHSVYNPGAQFNITRSVEELADMDSAAGALPESWVNILTLKTSVLLVPFVFPVERSIKKVVLSFPSLNCSPGAAFYLTFREGYDLASSESVLKDPSTYLPEGSNTSVIGSFRSGTAVEFDLSSFGGRAGIRTGTFVFTGFMPPENYDLADSAEQGTGVLLPEVSLI